MTIPRLPYYPDYKTEHKEVKNKKEQIRRGRWDIAGVGE